MKPEFHTLRLQEKIQETEDTVSLKFGIPENLKEAYNFRAGQYLTLKFNVKGTEARRAYSMSSAPNEDGITVSVKRVKGGLISNHIHDAVKVGDDVEVMVPQGRFLVNPSPEGRKTYYLFGAGSGITPLMSIAKTLLEEEAQSSVYLLYGNRNEDNIIFKSALDKMKETYKGQFFVEYILSQPKKAKAGGLAGMFGKKVSSWAGKTGRIDRRTTAEFLERNTPPYPTTEYYMCGPGNMIETVADVLSARGVNEDNVHFERFSSNVPGDGTGVKNNTAAPAGERGTEAIVHLDGKTLTVNIPEGKTVLDALLALKEDPPYSCTSGSCSTCLAKVLKGKVEMEVCYALDDDEIEDGFILTCQAKPTTSEIELTFEV